MSAAVRIREVTGGDLGGVRSIAADLKDAPQWPRSAYDVLLDPLARPERIALVAEDEDGRICGFVVAAMVSDSEAELESIAVEAGRQRRGVARALFSRLSGRLAGRGAEGIFLEVRESNSGAQSFYRAEGFSIAGRRPAYYADPPEDAVIMRLDLGRAGRG